MGVLDFIGKVANAVSPFGAIASGLGSIVSGISGASAQKKANETNLEIARQNNETAIQIARENNAFAKEHAIDMFNLENAYNDPSAQVARLTAAGLNPATVMENAGGTAVGNSSGSGMVSPSMPSLTTPHVEAVPPMAVGFLDALAKFSQIKLANSQAGKVGAETDRINKLLDQELLNMMADEKFKQAQTLYQNTIQQLEQLYGGDKRAADIAKTISEVYRNKMAGNDSAAAAALKKAEKELTDTKNKQLVEQAPVILENLRKSGELIDEQKKTEKAKQAAGYASAEESRERANLTRREAMLLEEQHDDLVYARRLENAKNFQELGEMSVTWIYRFEELKNRRLISDEQVKEAREAVERARKENTWFWWNKAIETVERINNGANKWAPWALSRDSAPSPGNVVTWTPSSSYGY